MNFCRSCGRENRDGVSFCVSCGKSLGQVVFPQQIRTLKKLPIKWVSALVLVFIAGASLGAASIPAQTTTTTDTIRTSQMLTTSVVQTVTLQTTSTTRTGQIDVTIKYTERTMDMIQPGYFVPHFGFIFLVVTFQIQNHANQEFNTNPNYFHVVVNKVKYDFSSDSYSFEDVLTPVSLLKGGSVSGSLAFEVPAGTITYTPVYDQPGTNFQIQWSHY